MASEAMSLAATSGLDTREAFDGLRSSNGNSWMFSNRVPPMLDPTHPPYSAIDIIAKDVVSSRLAHTFILCVCLADDTRQSLPVQGEISHSHFLYLQLLRNSTWLAYPRDGARKMTA